MTTDPTMEEYLNETRTNNNLVAARPKLGVNNKFVVKGQFLKLLRYNTFNGSNHEDADEQVEKILETAKYYRTKYTTFNLFML